MGFATKTDDSWLDSLKAFQVLQIIIGLICITIPFLLRCSDSDIYYPPIDCLSHTKIIVSDNINDEQKIVSLQNIKFKSSENCGMDTLTCIYEKICKDRGGFRISLSHYANSSNSYVFGMLYTMAAMMYLYNGVVYLKNNKNFLLTKSQAYMNFFIGICLFGVLLNPLSDKGNCMHYLFAVLFFLANLCLVLFFKNENETSFLKTARIVMGFIAALAFVGCIPRIGWYSVFWAETFSLIIIASYLIMLAFDMKKWKSHSNVT